MKNYIIEKREVSRKSWQTVATKCTRNTYKIQKLQEGVTYLFRVIPENEYGIGVPRETEYPITVTEVPGIPTRVDLVEVTKHSITLSWGKPEYDGGSRIVAYIMEICEKGSAKFSECARVKGSVLSHVIGNLREGKEYELRVRAQNEAGVGEPREAFSSIITKDEQGRNAIALLSIISRFFLHG